VAVYLARHAELPHLFTRQPGFRPDSWLASCPGTRSRPRMVRLSEMLQGWRQGETKCPHRFSLAFIVAFK
jgi:hypothetical protein